MINPEHLTTAYENIKLWLPLAPILTVSVKLFGGLVFESLEKNSWNAYLKNSGKLVVHRNGLAMAQIRDGNRVFSIRVKDFWKKGKKSYGKVKFPAPGNELGPFSQVVLRVSEKSPERYNVNSTIRARYFPDVSAGDWVTEKAFKGLNS